MLKIGCNGIRCGVYQQNYQELSMQRMYKRDECMSVAGRLNHFVCGVAAVQDLVTHNFELARLPRNAFCMYPEHILGMELNSPSMMWEHIDDIFHKVRVCMSSGRQGTTSASFSMPLLCTVYDFWQVLLRYNSYIRYNR